MVREMSMPALPLSLPSFSFLSLSLSPAFLSHLICDSTWRPNDSEIFLPNAFCSCLSVVVSILVVLAWLLLLLSISNKFCILNLHCSGYKTGGTDPSPPHTHKQTANSITLFVHDSSVRNELFRLATGATDCFGFWVWPWWWKSRSAHGL